MNYGYNPYGGYGAAQGYAQQAAQQAYAQQMQMGQAPMQQTAPPLSVRLVTSREEATTAQIPFDATINVFVNMAAGEVYIKRFNPHTGGAIFSDYHDVQKGAQAAQQAAQGPQDTQPQYATVEMVKALEARVSELGEAMRGGRAGE